uniref:Uncharacterized protein n=1 Tax=Tanacetum cinerariifolium TaxID=118510 RepID=A0A6L2J3A1_TANCI|nr:hypothetical protein [Tanacetum cinerariifolium]
MKRKVWKANLQDLSWTSLPEFADDTVTHYSRPSPAIESTLGDVQNRNTSDTKTEESTSIITSKPAIKFVKAAERPTTGKVETTKKPAVKYAKLYRKTTKRKRVKHGTSRSQNNTHKSFTPRPAVYKPYRPPMRPMRSNMNGSWPNRTSFYKPAHSYNKRPFQETTQNLVAILIQSVKRLERELKERTHIQKGQNWKTQRGQKKSRGSKSTEVVDYILQVKKKLLTKKLKDSEAEHQRVAPAEEFALLVKIILSQRCINVSQRHINNSQQLCDSYARMVPAAAKIKEVTASQRHINCIPTASDEFPLPDYFPTASEDMFPLLSERDAPAEEVCTADEFKD